FYLKRHRNSLLMNFFERHRSVLPLHFAVLMWGFTGSLRAVIAIPALQLVWYRELIAGATLAVYHWIAKKREGVPANQLLAVTGVGVLVGLHWYLFVAAIKVSTVSVTLVSLSSMTLFTAILEPIYYRRKLSIGDVIVGLIIILGIYLIFKFEFQYWLGILLGLAAAACASIFSILNSKLVKTTEPSIITQYEMFGALIGLSIVMLFSGGFNADMA